MAHVVQRKYKISDGAGNELKVGDFVKAYYWTSADYNSIYKITEYDELRDCVRIQLHEGYGLRNGSDKLIDPCLLRRLDKCTR